MKFATKKREIQTSTCLQIRKLCGASENVDKAAATATRIR